jgi:hypothetical protein
VKSGGHLLAEWRVGGVGGAEGMSKGETAMDEGREGGGGRRER